MWSSCRHTGTHLLICSHLTTPLEQGDLGLTLPILVHELVEKRGDNRPLLQSRLAALTSRGHYGTTTSTHQGTKCSVKRGLDPSSRAGAGQSGGKLCAGDGAERLVEHCDQSIDVINRMSPQQPWLLRHADTSDKIAGYPRVRNQIRAQVKLPGLRHMFGC